MLFHQEGQHAQPAVPVLALIAVGFVGVTGTLLISSLPGIVSALTGAGRLDAAMAGYVVAIDLGAQVGGTLLFMTRVRRLQLSAAISIGVALMVAGNVLSCFSTSPLILIATRLIAGGGAGILRSACFAVLACAKSPARAMAVYGVAQILSMSAAFAAFPWLVRTFGWFGPYMAFSVLGILTLTTAPWWPRNFRSADIASISLKFGRLGALSLVATFLYFLAQAGVWAFVEAIGVGAGHSSDSVASALRIVAIPGAAASFLAWIIGARIAIKNALLAGLSLTITALFLLMIRAELWTFSLGLGLFYFAWCATVPFLFASTAASDRSGNSAAAFPAADGLGVAAGPAFGGAILAAHGTVALVVVAALFTTISVVLFNSFVGQDDG